MQLFIFLVLLSYAVKCDNSNSNYYVIEMPADDLSTEVRMRKTFRVYWNVPTMQCASKKIPFENLYSKYGIIQNSGDSFRGDKVAILYDPGMFPALLKNETSGKFKFRNGGVPQEGSLEKHLEAFKSVLEQSVPDRDFDGIGIIDFESWRPTFRQNFGVLVPYKDVSYEIEREKHRWWPKSWIQEEARKRFEESGRLYMQNTISVAKQMRPRALWGYYGFPYCFESGNKCAEKVPNENDNLYWLWSESTALYPSVYSSVTLTSQQMVDRITARVGEAARVRRKSKAILPYFWYRYRDDGFLSKKDLTLSLKALYNSEATGMIIWGSSSDVNSAEKCYNLLDYLDNTLGPMIAKYTKPNLREDDELVEETDITTTENEIDLNKLSNRLGNVIDPELVWNPPVNYTQDIKNYVEEELKNKKDENDDDNESSENAFLKALLDVLFNNTKALNAEDHNTENDIKKDEKKKSNNKISLPKSTTAASTVNSNSDEVTTEYRTTLIDSSIESTASTTEVTSTEAYDVTTQVFIDDIFFSEDTLFTGDFDAESTTILDLEETSENASEYNETTTETNYILTFNLNDTIYLDNEENYTTVDVNTDTTTDSRITVTDNVIEETNSSLRESQLASLTSTKASNQVPN